MSLNYVIHFFLCNLYRVGQEDNKKLSDYQINAIKQKTWEMKNSFNDLFNDAECNSADFKNESKYYLKKTTFNQSIFFSNDFN